MRGKLGRSAERGVTIYEVVALMLVEGVDCIYGVPPPTKDMEDLSAVDVDEQDIWDLWKVWPSGVIGVRSSLCGGFSAILDKCRW